MGWGVDSYIVASLIITRANWPRKSFWRLRCDIIAEKSAREPWWQLFNDPVLVALVDAAWELDVWGKFRRALESGMANLDASIAGHDDVTVTLAGEESRATHPTVGEGQTPEMATTGLVDTQ